MRSPKKAKFQPQLTDSEIVKRVLLGEKELFEILVGRNNQSLYRAMRSYLKDENDVQDAMQEAYLKAYDKLQQFQGDSSFSTWLIRIGINEALLQLRAKKNIASSSVKRNDPQLQKLLQIPDKMQMNPENKIIQKEIRNVIELLNRRRNQIKLLLFEGDGFSIYHKRLERGTYEIPDGSEDHLVLRYNELQFILQGVLLKSVRHRKRFHMDERTMASVSA